MHILYSNIDYISVNWNASDKTEIILKMSSARTLVYSLSAEDPKIEIHCTHATMKWHHNNAF